MLLGEQLYYYKKQTTNLQFINMITLQNAKIAIQKSSQERIKLNKMYKYCFELENDTRTWIIACQSEQDLTQWYATIEAQINQVSKRIAIYKLN